MSEVLRECLSIRADAAEKPSVLVVSSDDEKESFRSNIFAYESFGAAGDLIFADDIWLSSMWKSRGGAHYACEILGTCFWQTGRTFASAKVSDKRLFKIWGLSDKAVFAVGAEGTCFRFDGSSWTDISKGLRGDMHAIGGLDEKRLVCAGDDGFLALWQGGVWNPVELHTNIDICGVLMTDDGTIYACGLAGGCLRLANGEVQQIETDGSDFYGIAEFDGQIYFGSAYHGIYLLAGNELQSIKPNIKGYCLDAGPTFMWTCGQAQTGVFDGKGWLVRPYS